MLFDKNGLYIAESKKDYTSYKQDYDFAVSLINPDAKDTKLYDLEEALSMGNLFPGLYKSYKDFRPRALSSKNDREAALLQIQKLDFTINDLNLYLDVHPEDAYMNKLFNKYNNELTKKLDIYNRTYGPLLLCNTNEDYEWSKSVWPWEEGRM